MVAGIIGLVCFYILICLIAELFFGVADGVIFLMSNLADRLRSRGSQATNTKTATPKKQQGPTGPMQLLKLKAGESSGPNNFPGIVVEHDGREVVSVTYNGRALAFHQVKVDKTRAKTWKEWYAHLMHGSVTEVHVYVPTFYGAPTSA